jgi:hypothetical protein
MTLALYTRPSPTQNVDASLPEIVQDVPVGPIEEHPGHAIFIPSRVAGRLPTRRVKNVPNSPLSAASEHHPEEVILRQGEGDSHD